MAGLSGLRFRLLSLLGSASDCGPKSEESDLGLLGQTSECLFRHGETQARSVGLQLSLELPLGLPKALAFCLPLKSSLEAQVVPSKGVFWVHGQGL